MQYTQPTCLKATILDCAGTVIDFGSLARPQIFVEAFVEFRVAIRMTGRPQELSARSRSPESRYASRSNIRFG